MDKKDKIHIETHTESKISLPYLNCAAVGGAISSCPEKEEKKKKKRKCFIKHLYLLQPGFLWRGKVSINVRQF